MEFGDGLYEEIQWHKNLDAGKSVQDNDTVQVWSKH